MHEKIDDFLKNALLSDSDGQQDEYYAKYSKKLRLTKSTVWKYEEEIRIYTIIESLRDQKNSFEFDPNDLISVYFGCKMEAKDEKQISELAQAINPDVKLYKIRALPDEYKLKYCPWGE